MAAAVEDEFMKLVDEYIQTYPLADGGALSRNCVRLAAGKLLLHKRQQQSGGPRAHWPGEGAARVAAILLVLFVQECLVNSQQAILGFDEAEFYEILSNLVRKAGVKREELVAELIDVDKEGSATQLASSNELGELWAGDGTADAGGLRRRAVTSLQAVKEAPDETIEWSDDTLLPETLSDTRLPGIASSAAPLYRRKLFLRSLRFRMACAVVSLVWFFAVEFICISRVYGKDFAQVALFCTTSSFGTTVTVASFPRDLASHKRFTFLPCCVTAFSVCIAAYLQFFYRSQSHVNFACTVVHAIVSVLAPAAWASAAVLSGRGWYTWRAARGVLFSDGATFLLGTIALRALGPPPAYPPGNISYNVALFRAIVPLVWSAILTPDRRVRFAELADRAGWNHATLYLREIKIPKQDVKLEDRSTAVSSWSEITRDAQLAAKSGAGPAHAHLGPAARVHKTNAAPLGPAASETTTHADIAEEEGNGPIDGARRRR